MKAQLTCHGEIIRKHGYADGRKSHFPCRTTAVWRVEWLSRAKVNGPTVLHQMVACSPHLVQILNQGHALAVGGDVHVLHVTDDTEWWPTD